MLAEAKTGVLELLVFIPFLHSFLRSTHVYLLVFLLTHLSWGNVTRCLFKPLETLS